MAQTSAAAALVRHDGEHREILLVHPGGPFFAKKDEGAWSLPKGLVEPGEALLAAAQRELSEELGVVAPGGPWVDLGSAKLKSGKVVRAFCARGDFDPATLRSNEIDIEWPPRSGRTLRIPEVDRAGWFRKEEALRKVNAGQAPLILAALAAELPSPRIPPAIS